MQIWPLTSLWPLTLDPLQFTILSYLSRVIWESILSLIRWVQPSSWDIQRQTAHWIYRLKILSTWRVLKPDVTYFCKYFTLMTKDLSYTLDCLIVVQLKVLRWYFPSHYYFSGPNNSTEIAITISVFFLNYRFDPNHSTGMPDTKNLQMVPRYQFMKTVYSINIILTSKHHIF